MLYRITIVYISKVLTLISLACGLLLALILSIQSVQSATVSCRVNASDSAVTEYTTIQAAIDDPQCTNITIAPGVYKERLIIRREIKLQGSGQTLTILDGESVGRVIDVISASVEISGVTIQNGFITDCRSNQLEGGGGIRNSGVLTLVNVLLQYNHAVTCFNPGLVGGAVLNKGEASVISSVVFSNSALAGGGIANFGTLKMIASAIANNRAIEASSVARGGGGLYNAFQANASISTTQLISNEAFAAGGGISSNGVLIVMASDLAYNRTTQTGGAITAWGVLTITNSRLMYNTATTGGGIYYLGVDVQDDSFSIQNSEVLSNSAESSGGGIYAGANGGDGVSVRIIANVFRANSAQSLGSAAELNFGAGLPSDIRFERNWVVGNLGEFGSTIRIFGRRFDLSNNIIAQNQGNGISVATIEDVNQFVNNTIWQNQGAGLVFSGELTGELLIQNNIVGANRSIGIVGPANEGSVKVEASLRHNNIWANGLVNYSGVDDQTGINGNLSVDPLMIAPNRADGHLSACSPLIDAGRSEQSPSLDFFGNPRPFNDGWDIGAVEFQGETVCRHSWLPFIKRH